MYLNILCRSVHLPVLYRGRIVSACERGKHETGRQGLMGRGDGGQEVHLFSSSCPFSSWLIYCNHIIPG